MMRVRLTTDRATLLGPAQRDGDIIEVSDTEGAALIGSRQAEFVETAAIVPPENASRKFTKQKQPTR